jgi:outer membrane assembly lipoprotein YfiO
MRADSANTSDTSAIPPRLGRARAPTLGVIFSIVCLALLSACSSTSSSPSPDPDVKEIKPKDAIEDESGPEADIFAEGKRLYQAEMYSLARNSFESIRDRFSLGAYGNYTQVKIADTYYYNNEYNEAAKFYEGYLKSYPSSPDAPYIELQAARAHVHSANGTGRDRQPLERALAIYDEMVKKYTGTPYAVINFYKQRENEAAVADREKLYQERWGHRLNVAKVDEAAKDPTLGSVAP